MTLTPFASEHAEIARIDFLLDQLARAVERGEVPRQSYDVMAPRYLARREDLVAIITGVNRSGAADSNVAPPTQSTSPHGLQDAAARQPAVGRAVVRRESKPVPWTTVLTFLGAFLVIVASAIFAVVAWDVIGVGGKLAFMGFLTALFYAGGWYARRIELLAGGTALTAVASAMLLFEGWIAIDGLGLEGPFPWGVVLLICSAVYWYTETRLAQRFFGVVGAAAQGGWWWLLGAGLGWPTPARLAGLALVALAWQLVSERGRKDRTLGSLARVLEWSAPIAVVLISLGVLLDLATLRNATDVELVYAGVVAAASGLVMWRSRLLAPVFNRQISALSQAPLFIVVSTVALTSGHSWWLVGVLAIMALVYDSTGLLRAGASFAVPGLLAEAGLVFEVCRVLDASDPITVMALTGLAVLWAVSARLLAHTDNIKGATGASEFALAAEAGGFILMVICSVAVLAVSDRIALTGPSLAPADVYLALGVLFGWWAFSGVSRSAVAPFAGSVWSFYALAALMSWQLPDQRPELYATGLVGLAGLWVASAQPFSERYGETWTVATRWAGRLAVALSAIAGLGLGFELGNRGTVSPAILMLITAAVYLLDTVFLRSRVMAAATAAAAVGAGAYFGGYGADRLGSDSGAAWFAVSATLVAAMISWGVSAWKKHALERSRFAAVAAALAASVLLFAAAEEPGQLTIGFALVALAWTGAAILTTQWLAVPAGLATVFATVSLLSYVDGAPWITTVVLTVVGFALGFSAFTRIGGPGGRFSPGSGALAISGVAGHAMLVGIGVLADTGVHIERWNALGDYGVTVGLIALGAHLIAQSVRWKSEPGHYIGGLILVCSAWSLFGAWELQWMEFYTTAVAIYLIAVGYLRQRLSARGEFPVVTDVGAVAVGLGLPLATALTAAPGETLGHAGWVLGLSLIAVGGGVVAKSRWYFFGGAAALTVLSLYRSFVALAEVWWLLLGFVGVTMLVIALTWERQRMLVTETRDRLRRSFENWR